MNHTARQDFQTAEHPVNDPSGRTLVVEAVASTRESPRVIDPWCLGLISLVWLEAVALAFLGGWMWTL